MAKDTVKLVLTGDRRLNRKLRKLQSNDARKVIRQAARPALKPVLKEARARVPVGESEYGERSGKLKKSLTVRALHRSRKRIGARVTTKTGLFKGDTFYGGFQEWGWRIYRGRGIKKGGAHKVPPQNFLLDSAIQKRRESIWIYRRELKRRITELAKREK